MHFYSSPESHVRLVAFASAAALLVACSSEARKGSDSASASTSRGGSVALTGAGATFPYPIYSKWFADYAAKTGVKINYQSIGSGGGIRQLSEQTVDFGASDSPMTDDEMAKAKGGPILHFPTVLGAVALIYNLPGLKQPLKLDGPTLADIYLGTIKKWNDGRIAALNPGAALPNADILVVHRSDGSGTSFIFTDYLSAVSPAWKAGPGEGKTVSWPTGVGGKGNEGVAAYVKQLPNSIGYVEYAYVQQNGMSFASLQNSAGNFVTPGTETFSNAAETADWTKASDFNLVMTNAPGANAYPLTATTFILMPKSPKDAAKSKAALDFFRFALDAGQGQAKALDYVPLPLPLVKQIEDYIARTIK